MRLNTKRCVRSWIPRILCLALILTPFQLISQEKDPAAAVSSLSRDPETAQKLKLAEGYHDLAILYLKKGELDNAFAEARQIAQLRLPMEYEKLVAQSLSIIIEKFSEVKRFDLGQILLDEALKNADQPVNKAKILRNKARLYMLAGDNDRAIDSWRRALDLEARRGR